VHKPHLHKVQHAQCTLDKVQRAHNANCHMPRGRELMKCVNRACSRLHKCGSVRPCRLGSQQHETNCQTKQKNDSIILHCVRHAHNANSRCKLSHAKCRELMKMHDQRMQYFARMRLQQSLVNSAQSYMS